MSDPIFLRNMINNTVYAEQIHSAQQSAQEAAREKNIRVQQQKVKEQALAVAKLNESSSLGIGEKGQQQPPHQQDDLDQEEDSKSSSTEKTDNGQGGVQHIDITV